MLAKKYGSAFAVKEPGVAFFHAEMKEMENAYAADKIRILGWNHNARDGDSGVYSRSFPYSF